MPEQQIVDPRIYGGQHPTYPERGGVGSPTEVPAVARTPVPIGLATLGTPSQVQGDVARDVQNAQPVATMLESAGAAVHQWSTGHVSEFVNQPYYPPVEGYNAAADMKRVPFPMDLEQEKMLLKSKSPDDFHYRLGRMEDANTAYQAMGDHPLVSMASGLADPGYLGISLVTLGAGRLAQLGGAGAGMARTAAGVSTFGAAAGLGKIEQQVEPISDASIVANAMLFGAAETVLFKAGKLVAATEGGSHPRLLQLAEEVANRDKPVALPAAHPEYIGPVVGHASPEPVKPMGKLEAGRLRNDKLEAAVRAAEEKIAQRKAAAPAEFDPNLNLSKPEQAAIHEDGVTHVNSVADIAEHAPSVKPGSIAADAKAVYLPAENRVFLIRDNIKPTDDIKGIMLHEVGVHMNAERVLGTTRMGEMLTRLEGMAKSGNARAKAAFESVPKDTPAHLVREEALGYYIERNHALLGDGVVSKFVHGVKEMLRKAGLQGLKLSENDISQLVRKAARGKRGSAMDSAFPYAFSDGSSTLAMSRDAGGTLARVQIKAPEHAFIDIASTKQSATVAAAFEKMGIPPQTTGRAALAAIAKAMGGEQAASAALHAEGVAGIKHARAYDVFHPDLVDTAPRYSKGAGSAPAESLAQKVGKGLSVSLHKTLSSFGDTAKKVADLLVDDPLSMAGNSVANQQRAIRADLAVAQRQVEDAILNHMASLGWGTRKQITSTKQAIAVQRGIEKEVYAELMRRNALSQEGKVIDHTGIPQHVKDIADKWDVSMKEALGELKRSGAVGAAEIAEHAGYVSRRWDNVKIEEVQAKLIAGGMSEDAARQTMIDALGIGMQRANGMDALVAQDVATATLDRARRKGYFEDTVLRRHSGEDTLAEVRDLLENTNIPAARREKVLEVMAGKMDEAGKAPALKHRVQVSLDEPIGNTGHTLLDLLDTGLVSIGERYLDNVSATSAFARKGLTKPSDIGALRSELLASIPSQTARGEAAKLFDNTVAALRGDPVGEEMHKVMRMTKGLTQMVGLQRAGLFQLTEFATLMADHGTFATVGHMLKEMPFVRGLLADPLEAGHLRNVLARNSSEDIRLRPFLSKMEDNFEIPQSDTAQLAIMQAKQLVPYVNGLKYVQGWQSRVAANLAVNVFERAAKGDIKALAALEHYGLESHIMGQVRSDIAAHGMDTIKWSNETWDAVRAPMTKMMDDSVLRSRTGEIPAFAQFSTTGKFIFTFRSFVLGAHNKVLAGTLNRKGFSGLGLILMHQLPLTYMIAQASNTMAGKPPLDQKKAIGEALGQAGALGLLSEGIGVAFGDKQQFGAPGFIAADRVYKVAGAAAKGDFGGAAAAGFNAVPLLSSIPVLKSIPEHLKGN